MAGPKRTSREDDFRDYEERDIRDGWPYPDNDGDLKGKGNAPYAAPQPAGDRPGQEGVEISTDPDVEQVEGAPVAFSEDVDGTVTADDLEERIYEALENLADIDLTSLEITIRDAVAHIDGAVDSDEDRRRLLALVGSMQGVRDVNAERLIARGADSHIPRDAGD